MVKNISTLGMVCILADVSIISFLVWYFNPHVVVSIVLFLMYGMKAWAVQKNRMTQMNNTQLVIALINAQTENEELNNQINRDA